MLDVPSSQAPGKLRLQKISELYQFGTKLSVGARTGGGLPLVPQTSSSYSSKVFICFRGNHEPIPECACEIVFIEDRYDWLLEVLQTLKEADFYSGHKAMTLKQQRWKEN